MTLDEAAQARCVATLEIRDAGRLNEASALALGRRIATSQVTQSMKHGDARAELRVSLDANQDAVMEWLEDQGLKLIVDRAEYAGIYTAKLYQ